MAEQKARLAEEGTAAYDPDTCSSIESFNSEGESFDLELDSENAISYSSKNRFTFNINDSFILC